MYFCDFSFFISCEFTNSGTFHCSSDKSSCTAYHMDRT